MLQLKKSINVYHNYRLVGECFADLLIEQKVIVELKAISTLTEAYDTQLFNYIKATKVEVGLLLNFGIEPDFKRIILTNDRKVYLKNKQRD